MQYRDIMLTLCCSYGSEMKAMTRLMPQFFVRSVDSEYSRSTFRLQSIALHLQRLSPQPCK